MGLELQARVCQQPLGSMQCRPGSQDVSSAALPSVPLKSDRVDGCRYPCLGGEESLTLMAILRDTSRMVLRGGYSLPCDTGIEQQESLKVSEKAMAPHSSTLAWKIPGMEEPGRLQSMGSVRVGHD